MFFFFEKKKRIRDLVCERPTIYLCTLYDKFMVADW